MQTLDDATASADDRIAATQPLDARLDGLPARTRRQLRQARDALGRRDAAASDVALSQAAAVASEHPEYLRLAGITRLLQRRANDAVAMLERARTLSPTDALILTNLGSALRGIGRNDEALDMLRRACELAPGMAAAWHNLAQALNAQAYAGEAREFYARALLRNPGHVDARIGYADALKTLGEIDAAALEYRRVLAQAPGLARAWSRLANLKTVRFDDAEIAQLRTLLRAPALDDEDRASVGFALAKALEDEDETREAFAVLSQANALRRRTLSWDAHAFSRHVEAISAAFASPPVTASAPEMGREVIFVVSLPRSGSSLTEQILASHPDVEGAGELSDLGALMDEESRRRRRGFPDWVADATPDDWRRLGERYLERTARWRRTRPMFTDKALDNWRSAGAALAMLPGARFVNVRRDPVENCLACYRQPFGKGHAYAYDLDEVAMYWRDYDRLMRLWHARYPGQFHDVVYEDLIADSEAEIHRLLAFCGLPFDEACLRFYETERSVRTPSTAQVRRPIASGTARAHRYGELLAPLYLALGKAPADRAVPPP